MFSIENKPFTPDSGPFFYPGEISLIVRRLDVVDPVTGGNKWFKLHYNLERLLKEGYSKMVTFGGAWSNHIAATARIGKLSGIETVGIIRGEPTLNQNVTLSRAKSDGMKLIFVSRESYKIKNESSFLKQVLEDHASYFVIPEGGSNYEGVVGCIEILEDHDAVFTDIVVACGTGTTAAGLIISLGNNQKLTGISVLRDQNSIEKNIESFLKQFNPENNLQNWSVQHDFHFGGYGKTNPILTQFIDDFNKKTGIPLEPVYTAKMFFGLEKLIHQGYFKPGAKILAIHTGGMQYLLAS